VSRQALNRFTVASAVLNLTGFLQFAQALIPRVCCTRDARPDRRCDAAPPRTERTMQREWEKARLLLFDLLTDGEAPN